MKLKPLAELRHLAAELAEKYRLRDELVVKALAGKIPAADIAHAIGVSRAQVYRMKHRRTGK